MKPFLVATLAAIGLTTCACSGGGGPTQPTHTITVTASASPSASQSATTQPAASTSTTKAAVATPAGCLTRYLNGSIGLTQGTAGAVEIAIVFKNLNNVPCTLYGFPGVAQAAGTPVTDIGHPSIENHSTSRELITLQPGGYANATLQIADATNFAASACTPKKATWLVVIPPNQTVPLYISYNSTACKGSAQLLSVTAVRPGNGG
ncbi:MAG TPA: DUF4232 domain-containing protein [Streptosporangiaceae bacterium]|jgi:hypothetical protein